MVKYVCIDTYELRDEIYLTTTIPDEFRNPVDDAVLDHTTEIIHPNGAHYWYKNGKLHRDGNKPAIQWPDGTRCWYKDGKKVPAPYVLIDDGYDWAHPIAWQTRSHAK